MAFTPEEEGFLQETWAEWSREAAKIGRRLGFKDYMTFKWFFRDFVKLCEKAGKAKVSGEPPYYDDWDLVDWIIGRDENIAELEREFGVRLEEVVGEEEPRSLEDLLKKVGVPALPDPRDPYAPAQMEEVVRLLAERLAEAEPMAGKIKVQVAGKTQTWGAKKVYEFVEQLNDKIRSLEREKEQLLRSATEKAKVTPIKLRVLKSFREGIIDYTVGSVVETRDVDWALDKIEKGLAERVAVAVPVEVKPPTVPIERILRPPTKPAELERKLRDSFEVTLRRAGLSPDRFMAEFRLELEGIKRLPTEEAMVDAVETLAMEIVSREAKLRPPLPAAPPREEEVRVGLPLPLPNGWRRVPRGFFDPWGNFIPEELYVEAVRRWEMKPLERGLWSWVHKTYGLMPGEFIRRPKEEQELIIAQFRRYLPAGFKSISFADWLKETKKITIDEYAELSNEEKAIIFGEYSEWWE